ncbi:MAG: hypothetical protein E7160_01190 [Firmicutes bacterium]|nr:hypothetical protein [Bacillota bacterium]
MKKVKSLIITFIIGTILSLPITTNALNISEEWFKVYGDEKNNITDNVVEDSQGNYVVAGYTNDSNDNFRSVSELKKYDTKGNVVLSKTYENYYDIRINYMDIYSDDTMIVVGSAIVNAYDSIDQKYIAKLNSLGEILWEKLLPNDDSMSQARVKITPDGGFVVIENYTYIDEYGYDSYASALVKYDSNGNVQWTKKDNNNTFEYTDIIVDTNGDYVLSALAYHNFDSYTLNSYPTATIIKLSSNGELVWRIAYNNQNEFDFFNSLCQNKKGNYVVVGSKMYSPISVVIPDDPIIIPDNPWNPIQEYIHRTSESNSGLSSPNPYTVSSDSSTGQDALAIEYDQDGNIVNSTTYATEKEDTFTAVTATDDGGFAVTGSSFDAIVLGPDNEITEVYNTDTSTFINIYDQDMNSVSNNKYDGDSQDDLISIIATSLGDIVAVGNTTSSTLENITNNGEADEIIVKLSPTFTVTKEETENGSFEVDKTSARHNDNITLTISPDAGYTLDEITVSDANNNTYEVQEENNTYYFKMPHDDATVNVKFKSADNEVAPAPSESNNNEDINDKNDKITTSENAETPNTGDDILKYMMLLISSVTLMTILRKTNKKSRI